MVEEAPAVYIFDGEDEFAINQSIDNLRARLGEAAIADMNITRLDGRNCTLAQIEDAAATVPFLAPKRLIIITNPLDRLKDKAQQERFKSLLSNDRPSSKLVLVDYDFLTGERDKRAGNLNWLESWALSPQQEKRVYIRHHPLPARGMMVQWIVEHAKSAGGQFTPQAALALATQVGDDTRLASQEIEKLLTFVNGSRPVEADDVEHLTPLTAKIGDFDFVNALRDRDARKAQALLHRSLEENDPIGILQTIVSQVRTLLVAHEILDEHGTIEDFPRSLKISYYPARLALESASRFSTDFLESFYHRLLQLDEEIKTGLIDVSLALELLVIELTG